MLKEYSKSILNTDPTLLIIAWGIASLFFIILYLLFVRHIMQKINKKVGDGSDVDEVPNKMGVYIVCALFWPAALVMGNNYLEKSETAQTGRMCSIIFLWFSGFIVILSLVTVYYLLIYLPEIIEFINF